jgi:branched-chain amino acid transport system substrate-binding protein
VGETHAWSPPIDTPTDACTTHNVKGIDMYHLGRERRARRSPRVVALCTLLAVVLAACGSSRKSSNTTNTTTGSGNSGGPYVVDTSQCPTGQDTTGISGNTIKIGISIPESGLYAPFTAILNGANAHFDAVNQAGGVELPAGSGKKYKIQVVDKDDAYDAAKTVQNVQSLINDDKVFSLFDVVGTKNNIGARDEINTDCVPNLLIASGAVQWGNTQFPWMLGSPLVPYPDEVQTFVNYLKEKKPDATIALLKANDDFGQSYADTLQELVKGTQMKIVQTKGYDPEAVDVKAQVTSLAATNADVFFIGATLLACPSALNAMGDAGWKPIVYMSGTCVSKVLLGAAGKNANGVLSVTPLLDPADPANDSNTAMKTYKSEVAAYKAKKNVEVDSSDGIVAFGWTQANLFIKILESAKSLDRNAVMNAGRNLTNLSDVGLQIPKATWTTGPSDWFLGETFQLITYDATAGHSNPIGGLTDLNGKTAELSPQSLLSQ